MTSADLDAALLDMTDSQIMALLARRTAAREQRKREQNAARVRNWRNANGNAGETQDVTQKSKHSPSECNANGNASVTQTVMLNEGRAPSPTPQVSPIPPSSPTPPPVHTQAREAETEKHLSDGSKKGRPDSESQVVAHCVSLDLPSSDGNAIWAKWQGNGFTNNNKPMKNWHQVIVSWKLHNYLPSQQNRSQFAKSLNGHNGHKPAPNIRDGINEEHFLGWLRSQYPRTPADSTLMGANVTIIERYREAHR